MTLLSSWLSMTIFWFLSVLIELDIATLNVYIRNYFYFLVSLLPTIKTLIVAFFQSGNQDELTGLCSVVNNTEHLFYFLVLPSSFFLFLGYLMIAISFLKILSIKFLCHLESRKRLFDSFLAEFKLTQLGVICFVSSLPILATIVCDLYEFLNRNLWTRLPTTLTLEFRQNTNSANAFIDVDSEKYKKIFYSNLKESYSYDPRRLQRPNVVVMYFSRIFSNFVVSFVNLILTLLMLKCKMSNSTGKESKNKKGENNDDSSPVHNLKVAARNSFASVQNINSGDKVKSILKVNLKNGGHSRGDLNMPVYYANFLPPSQSFNYTIGAESVHYCTPFDNELYAYNLGCRGCQENFPRSKSRQSMSLPMNRNLANEIYISSNASNAPNFKLISSC